jgi:hypothetical protein
MTNAADASVVLPGRPPIALRLLANDKSLVIEVWDHSPLDLEPREAGADAECGRGLMVVAALSDRWGCERTGHRRKVVWAEVGWPTGPGDVSTVPPLRQYSPLDLDRNCSSTTTRRRCAGGGRRSSWRASSATVRPRCTR